MTRAPITDEELEQWAKVRADDAGHLARELVGFRRTSSALVDVAAERRRQIDVEGFDAAHDDAHLKGKLAGAGVCYALPHCKGMTLGHLVDVTNTLWPFEASWLKSDHSRRDLVKAAALIIAEIERLDRQAAQP